jgi:DNA-binding beta-propeller fold protein YncE
MRSTVASILLIIAAAFVGGEFCTDRAMGGGPPDHATQIQPILDKYCVACHGGDEVEGGLKLDSFDGLMAGGEHGAALTIGEPASSRMLLMTTGKLEPKMPPDDMEGPNEEELGLLTAWIEAGAKGIASPGGDSPAVPIAAMKLPSVPRTASTPLPMTAVAISLDGNRIATATASRVEVRIGGEASASIAIDHGMVKVNALQWSNDGSQLLIAGGAEGQIGRAMVYRVDQPQQPAVVMDGHRDILYAADWSPDGNVIATAGYDRTIQLWDVATGKNLQTLKGHNGAVFAVDFSPDGSTLISGAADDTAKVWDVATGQRLDTLAQPQGAVLSVAFTPDGEYLVAGSADNRLRVWRFVSRGATAINPMIDSRFADDTAIDKLAIPAHGQFAVVVARSGKVKLFDTKTWNQFEVLPSLNDSPTGISISGDGGTALVSQLDGTFATYTLPDRSGYRPFEAAASRETLFESASLAELTELEGNDAAIVAQPLQGPSVIHATIGGAGRPSDEDWYRFAAKQGQVWMIEVQASRDGSPLDSIVEVRSADGKQIPKARLQATRDTYFTFRGKDSIHCDDFRMFRWEEMELNEYLYANGEVVKLWLYPRGPDSGFIVYPGDGERWTYFDTTADAHALAEPAYVVRPLADGEPAVANGLPVFTIYNQNDDDPLRRWGSDSSLRFVAPQDGDFCVRVRDVRGQSGDDYRYRLTVRPAKPDFTALVSDFQSKIPKGAGREFTVEVDRIDGMEGDVTVAITGLPEGFYASTPLTIEAGQQTTTGVIYCDRDAALPIPASPPRVVASAEVHGQRIEHVVEGLAAPELIDPVGVELVILPIEEGTKVSSVDVDLVAGNRSSESGPLPKPSVWTLPAKVRSTVAAQVHIRRLAGDDPISFGNEGAGRSLPHGSFVDNIGLNGLLIMPGSNQRSFFINAGAVTRPQKRLFYLKAGVADGVCSWPVWIDIQP